MELDDQFTTLLTRHKGMLFALCRWYERRGATADDLFQDAVLSLWNGREKLLQLPTRGHQAAWIRRVARNAMLDTLRRTRQTVALPDDLELPADDNPAATELHEHIALLPEPDNTIMTMHLAGYTYDEIAADTGLTVKNVGVRLSRIRQRLRKAMCF